MLKGTTKIELTNVKTGEKEVIEKHNYITCGISEWLKPMGQMFYFGDIYNCKLTRFFGSIHLFGTEIEGDEETTMFPSGDNEWVGGAEYGYVNSTTHTQIGNYNANESLINYVDKTAKFVYDFSTNQCNGEIASVCLAPLNKAKALIWGQKNNDTSIPMFNDTGHFYQTPNMYLKPENYAWTFRIDPKNNIMYAVVGGKIKKYDFSFCSVSLFDRINSERNITVLNEVDVPKIESYTMCRDSIRQYDDKNVFLWYTHDAVSSKNTQFDAKALIVNIDTGEIVKTITIGADTTMGSKWSENVHYTNGYIYVYKWAIPIENPSLKYEIEFNCSLTSLTKPFFQVGDFVYYVGANDYASIGYSSSSSTRFVLNTKKRKVSSVRTKLFSNSAVASTSAVYSYGVGFYHNFDGYKTKKFPLCHDTSWSYRTLITDLDFFLSTINNLDEPVQKTSDKTMKITYTVQEI